MNDDFQFDTMEEALTEAIEILESKVLLQNEWDSELESVWSELKTIREEVREENND